MKLIEENSEKLELLQKAVSLEMKQKNRLTADAVQKQKETEKNKLTELYAGNSPSTSNALDFEDNQRRELVQSMVENSTQSNAPIVKCVSNMQGKKYLLNIDLHRRLQMFQKK